MSSTLATPPPASAAKRYSNLFRGSRLSMMRGPDDSNDDLNAPSYFDDLAFLDESGGLGGSTTNSKTGKNKLRPMRKSKDKGHASKSSASGFLRKSTMRSSTGRGSKSPSMSTTTTTTFVEYPFYHGTPEKPSMDLASIVDSEADPEDSLAPSRKSNSDSDGGGGFFNDLAFLEAQEEVIVQTKSPKNRSAQLSPGLMSTATLSKFKSSTGSASPKSSSSSTFTRFRTNTSGSAGNSIRSRTTSIQSSISASTLTNPSIRPRTSQILSPISPISPNLASPPPSLATHSSSPSLSSTMLSSPSATSRHTSMQFNSSKGLPALPIELSTPEGETPRAATFGRDQSSSPRPSAQYIFEPPSPIQPDEYEAFSEPPSPHPPSKFPSLDIPPRSPRQLSSSLSSPSSPNLPSRLQRDFIGGPIPPPKHSRQRSANYQVQSEITTVRPPRHSSLGASASSPAPTSSVSPALPVSERLNRASLSAVLAREEKERTSSESRRSSRSSRSGTQGTSQVNPTAEDLALLPTFSHLTLASSPSSAIPPVPPVPAGFIPALNGRRRSFRHHTLSMDGGASSRCHSIIAAFPTPPEATPPSQVGEGVDVVDEEDEGPSPALVRTLAQMHSQLYPHLPPLTHPDWLSQPSALPSHLRSGAVDQDVRPESDAFSFDDDYWLATPSGSTGATNERREGSGPIPHPLRLVQNSAAVGPNGTTTPTTPTLLTPELMYPALVTPSLPLPQDSTLTYRKAKNTSSLENGTVDINSLIEHARPESATLPDFVNIDREGSLRSTASTHVQPSEDGTDEYNDDHEEVLTYESDCEGDFVDGDQDDASSEQLDPIADEVEAGEHASRNKGSLTIKVDQPSDVEPPRSESPTSEAARMDAFFALESLASAAGYRLVRASYVPPREADEGSPPDATTPTAASTPTPSTPLAMTASAMAGHL